MYLTISILFYIFRRLERLLTSKKVTGSGNGAADPTSCPQSNCLAFFLFQKIYLRVDSVAEAGTLSIRVARRAFRCDWLASARIHCFHAKCSTRCLSPMCCPFCSALAWGKLNRQMNKTRDYFNIIYSFRLQNLADETRRPLRDPGHDVNPEFAARFDKETR